jgi:SAM-dependent methyltransferase
MLPDRHLDLGCGKFPRNPYRRGTLAGIDARPLQGDEGFDYRIANLALQPIPFQSDHFGSVSAFDFIEHVPRLLPAADGQSTVFPFIRLMDEVWRVLAPGGRFYALTPAFPHPEAFVDPTHVNIIADGTHAYFCGESPMARMYGFRGRFVALRAERVHLSEHYGASADDPANRPNQRHRGLKGLSRRLRTWSRQLRGKNSPRERKAYLLWELEAIKPPAP